METRSRRGAGRASLAARSGELGHALGWRCWSWDQGAGEKGAAHAIGAGFCGGMLEACLRESCSEGTVHVLVCVYGARACVENGAGKGAAHELDALFFHGVMQM